MKVLKIFRFLSWILIFQASFSACEGIQKNVNNTQSPQDSTDTSGHPFSKINYAKGFDIMYKNNVSVVQIFEPGKKRIVRETYYVIKGTEYLDSIDKKLQFLCPVDSIAVFAATQLNALGKIGLLNAVIGVSEAEYIRNKKVQERYRQGLITDLAGSGSFFVEKTLKVNPRIIFYSPYNTSESHPLAATKIPMISFLDFMEEDPLGRAEWIKFTAVFFGKEKLANSIFDNIVEQYNSYKEIAANAANQPTVFSDKYFNGQWFVPGGKSYIAKLFADANANYVWKNDQRSGSFPLDFEVVFNEAGNADFWRIIGSYNEKPGYENLAAENDLYTHFKAFQQRHVIYCNAENTAYFENSPLEPHLILADLIKAFHPELLPDYQPVYYKVIP